MSVGPGVRALAALLVAAATLGCGQSAPSGKGPGSRDSAASGPGGGLRGSTDGTIRLEGTVLENVRLCEIDAACWLVLDVGGRRYDVIYHPGEAGTCPNREAGDRGIRAEPGDRLAVFGAYERSGNGGTISTCPETRFYIRPASEGPDGPATRSPPPAPGPSSPPGRT